MKKARPEKKPRRVDDLDDLRYRLRRVEETLSDLLTLRMEDIIEVGLANLRRKGW